MFHAIKKPLQNIFAYFADFLPFTRGADFRSLSKYILKINTFQNMADLIHQVSSCLKAMLSSELCCLVIKQGASLKAWADPRICENQMKKVIQKDFACQIIDDYSYFEGDQMGACHISDRLIHHAVAYELKEAAYAARIYILPKERMLRRHPEIFRDILEATKVAIGNYLTIRTLQNEAGTDHLTNCLNRRTMESRLDHDIAIAERYGGELSVIMLDIDHFKRVNDTYGHLVGDGVLKEISSFITPMIRKCDYLARWGGEEFVLALPNTELYHATRLAESIRSALFHHVIHLDGRKIKITASLGVASLMKGFDRNKLLAEVDRVLYQAKTSGRNRVCDSRNTDRGADAVSEFPWAMPGRMKLREIQLKH